MSLDMPSSVDLEQAFGPGGVVAATGSALKDLREQERAGRLMRDGKVEENCIVTCEVTATFTSSGSSVPSQWIDFGHIHFISRPVMVCGSMRLPGQNETPLDQDYSNFSLTSHETVPCIGTVIGYRTERGLYTGAKVALFALDTVSAGFKSLVGLAFIGPAVRMG